MSLKFWYVIVYYIWYLLIPLILKVTYCQSMSYFRNTFSTAYRTFIFFPRIDCGLFWHTCANTLSKLVCVESMHKFCFHSVTTSITNQTTLNGNKMKRKRTKISCKNGKKLSFLSVMISSLIGLCLEKMLFRNNMIT